MTKGIGGHTATRDALAKEVVAAINGTGLNGELVLNEVPYQVAQYYTGYCVDLKAIDGSIPLTFSLVVNESMEGVIGIDMLEHRPGVDVPEPVCLDVKNVLEATKAFVHWGMGGDMNEVPAE